MAQHTNPRNFDTYYPTAKQRSNVNAAFILIGWLIVLLVVGAYVAIKIESSTPPPTSAPSAGAETLSVNETGEPVTITPVESTPAPTPSPTIEPTIVPDEKEVAVEVGSDKAVEVGTVSITPQLPEETVWSVEPTTLPYCEQEDSINCFWDAQILGNGTGESFVNIGGSVYYLPSN